MKRKKNSFLDHLESYLSTYLPKAKGLSDATIVSYKATFRILMEFMYQVKGVPADKVSFSMLDEKLIIEFLTLLHSPCMRRTGTLMRRLDSGTVF